LNEPNYTDSVKFKTDTSMERIKKIIEEMEENRTISKKVS
jgi:hypothetical protein